MRNINVLLVLLFISSYSFGQGVLRRPGVLDNTNILRTKESIIVIMKQPLLYIGNLETKYGSLFIEEGNLKIIETYTDSTQLQHFGEKGEDGVIIAELKNEVPLFRLEEVLDYFQVPADNRHVKVLVDKRFINPDLFLADIKQFAKIEVLEVTQQDILLSPVYNSNWVMGEKYLNIVTVEK